MPKLSDRIRTVSDDTFIPQTPSEVYGSSAHGSQNLQPGMSPFMRCPLPPVAGVSQDSLRQFYRGGILPQKRLLYSPQ